MEDITIFDSKIVNDKNIKQMNKSEKSKTDIQAIEWYAKNRYLYKQLTSKVHAIINELLALEEINIHAIFSRTKDLESFKEKIKDPKYSNPIKQITDLSGLRIICYVESDIPKIRSIIEKNFEIDIENSGDKSKLLGTDKVGYKSVHFVGKLKDDRLHLPEYKNYSDCKFEIQIRTILQHAWAEIEHDRNYKFSGELPEEIQRRFMLVAGSLELADKEFDRIALEIDSIKIQVKQGTKVGKLDFEINTTTLKQFLTTKFESIIPSRLSPDFQSIEGEFEILDELNNYGLKTLDDLNKIIPPDFIKIYKKHSKYNSNFIGLLRDIMICNDWKNYFDNAYKNTWTVFSLKFGNEGILKHYKVPVDQIIDTYEDK